MDQQQQEARLFPRLGGSPSSSTSSSPSSPPSSSSTMASVALEKSPFSPPTTPRGYDRGPVSPRGFAPPRPLGSPRNESSASLSSSASGSAGTSTTISIAVGPASKASAVEEVDILDYVARAAKVYCSGELLACVQMSGLFEDSKEFVDMPMRHDPEIILHAFHAIPPSLRRDPTILRAFLAQHFSPPGSELVPHLPTDHTDSPAILDDLDGHGQYHQWAVELNRFWKELCRKVHTDVDENPQRGLVHPRQYHQWAVELNRFRKELCRKVHTDVDQNSQRYSILRRRFPLVIPGGRFRESYYWDSYWIVLGLLACDMKDTARGVIQNLLDDVATFGFVPNGGRIYYLNRSQPPLLSEMVLALVEHDPSSIDEAFVAEALAVLEIEYRFWMKDGQRAVTLQEPGSTEKYVLNRYWTESNHPRPESYKEDLHHAGLADYAKGFYADIAAGAESGWDFSSRWIRAHEGGYPLERISTTSIIPVDLNSFLYRMERTMARLHDYLLTRQMRAGVCSLPADSRQDWISPKAQYYNSASSARALAMDRLLWSNEEGMWKDYWISSNNDAKNTSTNSSTTMVRAASNYMPLWGRVAENPVLQAVAQARKTQAFSSLNSSGLIQIGGVTTTNIETGEQWDKSNAWSPIVHMVIDGLEGLGTADASSLARSVAKNWLESNYLGWSNTGYMYEKYHAMIPGARGEGGEYYPQVGFGWTNGVVLHLLKTYGKSLTSASASPASSSAAAAASGMTMLRN